MSRLLLVLLAGCLAFGTLAWGQGLREQPTPFSVYLDLQTLVKPGAPKIALPLWLEAVRSEHQPARGGSPAATIYRLHLRQIGSLNSELLLRVFFDDLPDAPPQVSAWTETGTLRFEGPPLGTGLGLPTSAEVVVPVDGVDYVEVAVPGDGLNIRGLWLATARRGEQRHAFDFALPSVPASAFGNLPPAVPVEEEDQFLFGRVRALLEVGPLPLQPGAQSATTLEFELDRQPLVAVLTFEVLQGDLTHPLQVSINDRPPSPAALHLPDLADPGYKGAVRPRQADVGFRYAGWLRAQVVVPGSVLRSGLNRVQIALDKGAGSCAVRSVELQLKHPWRNIDPTLQP